MGGPGGETVRLRYDQIRTVSGRPGNARGSLYRSRAARVRPDGRLAGERLRRLATEGVLAQHAAAARGYDRLELSSAAYDLVWPIVFTRLTRRFEQMRGHMACASGVGKLADECLDRFHDDVEAVVEDLLTHARRPVENLEAWVAARLGAATVDAHRRRRGERGALQRPRLPGWLADELGRDPWLTTLATQVLVWVGVDDTAGSEVWPLESWAQERARCVGDWPGSDRATVAREIEAVLGAMRKRPAWYESFVERPLGAKRAPVVSAAADRYGEQTTPLALGEPDQEVDLELLRLARRAVSLIDRRVAQGEEAHATVTDVIRDVFGGVFTGTLDRAPHSVADPVGGVTGALASRGRLDRIVTTALSIIAEGDEATARS
ncbi:hypothetical protein SAMN06264365_10546 [Actinoplanes regularis]|uniref:Uncharacterized protein n=1 Tax=Actinoplanes regularis TaxID=52697 RepID=A0A238YP71_9ACTN|nr:hypothetical protein Are01nite_19050 [Actinoplanes regularis]SNR72608.1 hypothetical protein SAMN06264365_10546 [Actinoplanes regularis]